MQLENKSLEFQSIRKIKNIYIYYVFFEDSKGYTYCMLFIFIMYTYFYVMKYFEMYKQFLSAFELLKSFMLWSTIFILSVYVAKRKRKITISYASKCANGTGFSSIQKGNITNTSNVI